MSRISLALLLVLTIGCGRPRQEEPAPTPPRIPVDAISTVILHDVEITQVFSNKLFAVTADGSILIFSPNNEVYRSTAGVDEPFASLVQTVEIKEKVFHGAIFVDENPKTPYVSSTGWKLRFGDPAPGATGSDYAVLHIEPVNIDAERKTPKTQATSEGQTPYVEPPETRLRGPKP